MTNPQVLLDVREDLRAGRAPCARIMEAARQLDPGATLQLRVPFEPVPLYDVLGREGFVHESRELGGGDWEVRFKKDPAAAAAQAPTVQTEGSPGGCGCGCSTQEVQTLEIDVRGLEPPQPMMRILEALASLPHGVELRARTDRRPLHLLEQIEARGFRAESEESVQGGCITVIRRR